METLRALDPGSPQRKYTWKRLWSRADAVARLASTLQSDDEEEAQDIVNAVAGEAVRTLIESWGGLWKNNSALTQNWKVLIRCELCYRFGPERRFRGYPKTYCSLHTPRIPRGRGMKKAVSKDYKLGLRLRLQYEKTREVIHEQTRLIWSELGSSILSMNKHEFRHWISTVYPFIAKEYRKACSPQELLKLADDVYDPVGSRKIFHEIISANPEELRAFMNRCESWWSAYHLRYKNHGGKKGGKRAGAGRKKTARE